MPKYRINPANHTGEFRRTVRVEGREPRLIVFTSEPVEIDALEVEQLAKEIRCEAIVPKGYIPLLKPRKEPPRRDVCELEERHSSVADWLGWVRRRRTND
ncbi:MAG TPA: hypothetical protein PKC18_18835 [Lacipirellulaceae bacterium]|nr:hypothetical protein [Lacipirellulaceae bacterium]